MSLLDQLRDLIAPPDRPLFVQHPWLSAQRQIAEVHRDIAEIDARVTAAENVLRAKGFLGPEECAE